MQVMEAWDVIENDKVWVVSIGAVGSVCVRVWEFLVGVLGESD